MPQKNFEKLKNFFRPQSTFTAKEWILKQQIQAMLILSFFFGLGVFFFSIFRLSEQNYIVGISQFIFSTFSLYGFISLKKDKKKYERYALNFFFLFFIYTGILFFYVPQNTLNILWVISAPFLIFFFLNKKGGTVMFLLIFLFIIYLIITGYHYNPAEFITLLAAFFITSFIMYTYENIKEAENRRLLKYTRHLEKRVQERTLELKILNEHLEERVEEEMNRRQAQEQMLLSQNRMANMGIMIDAIAHQWRQPLMHINAILMNVSRITETEPHNIDYVDDKVEEIFQITHHMSQTIHDFRNLFQAEKEKNFFEIEQLLTKLLQLIQSELKEVEVTIESSQKHLIKSYQNELSQVILILLHNAIEALKESKMKEPQITITIEQNETETSIEFKDNAGGIQPDIMKQIFDPYFSTKKERLGSGLGLYIAKLIMEQNIDGNISVKNEPLGANFKLTLPKSL